MNCKLDEISHSGDSEFPKSGIVPDTPAGLLQLTSPYLETLGGVRGVSDGPLGQWMLSKEQRSTETSK
jgi:hypothetical protein